MLQQILVGQGLLIIEASRSHSDTQHSLRLLWTSNQPNAENSTWQHRTLTRDRHPCPRWDSNPQFQQAADPRLRPRDHWNQLLTLILLTWRIWWASNNASRWQTGFNSAFKRVKYVLLWMKLPPSHVTVSKDNKFNSSSHRPIYILFFRITASIYQYLYLPLLLLACFLKRLL